MTGNPFHAACWSMVVGIALIGLAALSQVNVADALLPQSQGQLADRNEPHDDLATATGTHPELAARPAESHQPFNRTGSDDDHRVASTVPFYVDSNLHPQRSTRPSSGNTDARLSRYAAGPLMERVVPSPADVADRVFEASQPSRTGPVQLSFGDSPQRPTNARSWNLLESRIDAMVDAQDQLADRIDDVAAVADLLKLAADADRDNNVARPVSGTGTVRR